MPATHPRAKASELLSPEANFQIVPREKSQQTLPPFPPPPSNSDFPQKRAQRDDLIQVQQNAAPTPALTRSIFPRTERAAQLHLRPPQDTRSASAINPEARQHRERPAMPQLALHQSPPDQAAQLPKVQTLAACAAFPL